MHQDPPVRIQIVGHEGIVRESLALILARQPGIVCVDRSESADVILVNHDPEWDKPLTALVAAASRDATIGKILVITTGLDEHIAANLVRQGVRGIFLKRNSLDRLIEALRSVAAGETWMDEPYSRFSRLPFSPNHRTGTSKAKFTERELLTLRAVVEGCSNKEIGARLGASESAAKGLLQRLFRKTSVRSRGQLIRITMERYRELL